MSTDSAADLAGIRDYLARIRHSVSAPGTRFEITEEEVRGVRMPVFRNRTTSMIALLRDSVRFADRHYVVDGDVRLDFRTHVLLVDALATALQREHGLRPGDRMALYAANRWEWIVSFWAVVAAGGVPVACNGWWTPDEFAAAADLVRPSLVIADSQRLARVAAAGHSGAVLDLDTDVPRLLDEYRGQTPVTPDVAEDDPAMLIFTSGATGRAKAVTVPHRAVCGYVQLNAFFETVGRVARGAPVPGADDPLPASDDVILVTSPLFHISMLQAAVVPGVVKGSTMVLLPGRFDAERVLATIERERVTMWMALGSAAPRVCAHPGLDAFDTSSLRYLGVGGAPVSPAVQRRLRNAFPSASGSLGMGYASSESGAVVANIAGPEYAAYPTSTGRVAPTTAVELRDAYGKPVPDGELGEVHVRSPYVMLGYWNDPAATNAVLKDGGWLAMGDLARCEDGLLFIDSRARDMIQVSAENVSPPEVEYRLEAHPEVVEAAVLAVDDDVTGDAVYAVVTVAARSTVTSADLAAWCRETLAHYKVPTRWRLSEEPLPRTASGKLAKTVLRLNSPTSGAEGGH